jgi:hypothetical protein
MLSVVSHALLCHFLFVGFLLFTSGDADGGCLWELRVSEKWIPYWSPSEA